MVRAGRRLAEPEAVGRARSRVLSKCRAARRSLTSRKTPSDSCRLRRIREQAKNDMAPRTPKKSPSEKRGPMARWLEVPRPQTVRRQMIAEFVSVNKAMKPTKNTDTIDHIAIPVPSELGDSGIAGFTSAKVLYVEPNGIVLNPEVLAEVPKDKVIKINNQFVMAVYPKHGLSAFFYQGVVPPFVQLAPVPDDDAQYVPTADFSMRHDGTRLLDWNLNNEVSYSGLTRALEVAPKELCDGCPTTAGTGTIESSGPASEISTSKLPGSFGSMTEDGRAACVIVHKRYAAALAEGPFYKQPWSSAAFDAFMKEFRYKKETLTNPVGPS